MDQGEEHVPEEDAVVSLRLAPERLHGDLARLVERVPRAADLEEPRHLRGDRELRVGRGCEVCRLGVQRCVVFLE